MMCWDLRLKTLTNTSPNLSKSEVLTTEIVNTTIIHYPKYPMPCLSGQLDSLPLPSPPLPPPPPPQSPQATSPISHTLSCFIVLPLQLYNSMIIRRGRQGSSWPDYHHACVYIMFIHEISFGDTSMHLYN